MKLKTSLVEIVAKRLKVNFYDILCGEVTILPCASLSTQALSKLGLLKQQQYLLRKRGRILVRPEPCHAVFDQLAAGRRPSTDDRFTVRPSFDVGDAKRFVRGRKTEDIASRQCVGLA